MKAVFQSFFFSLLIPCLFGRVYAQNPSLELDTSKFYKIEMREGSIFLGYLLKKDQASLTIQTPSASLV
ncbi:MAG: hypothetical protein ACKOA4_00490, partial [Haliscomenobacter sp.]